MPLFSYKALAFRIFTAMKFEIGKEILNKTELYKKSYTFTWRMS
ncbi:hypothetical protein [uncultured Campylobacter sp.]|nr:hypothetical protein [uncultured Campylobacter sp.]